MSVAALSIDVLTIFPDYLKALDLSLIGRAAGSGLLRLRVHDLRRWTHDRHRTVDDTPLGGGAGMVMRPDVWGEALDEILSLPAQAARARADREPEAARQILVIPTPSGEVFTQRAAEELAEAGHLVFACGRYEGIDARVAQHYRAAGIEVRELSIGDYVLNGGEVAALVMIEAIARLRPGVLGNPDSVVEESHSVAGLLEYPVYTRPVAWRETDLAVSDPVLLSGDHQRIARARRDQAIARTARQRPDMIARLSPDRLDSADRAALAENGWVVPPGARAPLRARLRPARPEDLPAVRDLAVRTFPDACPAFLSPEEISSHMDTVFRPARLSRWQQDPRVVLVVAELDDPVDIPSEGVRLPAGALVGYSVLLLEQPDAEGVTPEGLDPRPACVPLAEGGRAAELSKVYVEEALRSSGLAAALVQRALADAQSIGALTVWLGTHEGNKVAQRAYKRSGLRKVGTRSYEVGGRRCRDVVMARELA